MKKVLLGLLLAVSVYGIEVKCNVGKYKYSLEVNENEIVDIVHGDLFLLSESKVNKHNVKVYQYENINNTLMVLIATDLLYSDGIADIYIIGNDALKGICFTDNK